MMLKEKYNNALQLTQQYTVPLRSAPHHRSAELRRYTQN